MKERKMICWRINVSRESCEEERTQEAAERKKAEVVLTQGRGSIQEHDDCSNYYFCSNQNPFRCSVEY